MRSKRGIEKLVIFGIAVGGHFACWRHQFAAQANRVDQRRDVIGIDVIFGAEFFASEYVNDLDYNVGCVDVGKTSITRGMQYIARCSLSADEGRSRIPPYQSPRASATPVSPI